MKKYKLQLQNTTKHILIKLKKEKTKKLKLKRYTKWFSKT